MLPNRNGCGQKVILLDTKDLIWGQNLSPKQMPINLNLGLLSIGTLLQRSGFDVKIIDLLVDMDYEERIEKSLSGGDVLLALVSVTDGSVKSGMDISRRIKLLAPSLPVIWGSFQRGFFGPFVNLYPEVVLKSELVDMVILGDEYTVLSIANILSQYGDDKENSLQQVRGIGYKQDGQLIFTEAVDKVKERPCIEEDYRLVDIEKYILRPGRELARNKQLKRILPISTGEGCPYQCTFCINSVSFHRRKFRLKPAEMIIRQLEVAIERYGVEVVWFQDDNLFADKKRAFVLFNEIERRGWQIKWAGQTRLNYFSENYISDEWFANVSKNCIWFGVGFETISDRLRKIYNKNVTTEILERVAELCRKNGVLLAVAFIVGTVDETRREMLDTMDYILSFKERFPYTSITYQVYRPYRGSVEYEKIKAKGYPVKEPEDLEGWATDTLPLHSYQGFSWLDEGDKKELIKPLLKIVSFFNVESLGAPGNTLLERLVYRLHRSLAQWRLRNDFWQLNFEPYVARLAIWLLAGQWSVTNSEA
jgi:anaerobic magnesium-protoporphyrin IX monomethyl ester cyclase